MNNLEIKNITESLYQYAKQRDFSGWDPYDGLNSLIFRAMPFKYFRICRLAWIQFFKRCPVNVRPLFLVPKGRNPKGIALFASAAINLFKITNNKTYLDQALTLLQWLRDHSTKGYSGHAWGYNFFWQGRNNLFPLYFPTIVTTSFVGRSFLDGYNATNDKNFLEVAKSAAIFIIKDFFTHRDDDGATGYSYGPKDQSCVYNATALGGHFFAKLFKATGETIYQNAAANAIKFVVKRQEHNGSWRYGDHATQQWIDSFHTGYNLLAIKKYGDYTGDHQFENAIKAGYSFYEKECFTPSGEPKYYSHSFYPIDIHACAVAAIMFTEFGKPERAKHIIEWTVEKLWNPKGCFDYQITKHYRNSISYMRWSQAWMLKALTNFLSK